VTDPHARFRERLAGHLAEVLPAEDEAWMVSHAAACEACAALRERVRARLPEVAEEAGHVPVRMLEHWVRAPGDFTPLERHLLERHLADCEDCRGDAEELARARGVPWIRPRPRSARAGTLRRVALGVAVAASLVAVFLVGRLERLAPMAPGTGVAPPEPTRAAPPAPAATTETRRLVIHDRSRGEGEAGVPSVQLARGGTDLTIQLPTLFLDPTDSLRLRVLDAEGGLVVERVLPAGDAARDVALTPRSGTWVAGAYRVELEPVRRGEGARVRVYAFRLLPPDR